MSVIIISNASGGGSGMVDSVTAGDLSIVVGGTASNPTIETGTLDEIATLHPPAGPVAMNSKKITALANGSASTDAAAFGQLPVLAAADTSIVVAGTATAPTVATGTLDVITAQHPPAANWSNNGYAITGVSDLAVSGLTGATSASRYVGATTSGAPASGTFAVGDFVIDQSGLMWVCTIAGTPGTWATPGAGTFLCAPVVYAPSSQTVLSTTSSTLSAVSSTHVNTGSFTAPSSGSVIVTASMVCDNTSGVASSYALAAHGTVTPVVGNTITWMDAGSYRPRTVHFLVSGLTAGTSYNFDLLFAAASGTTQVVALGASSTTPTGTTGAPVLVTVQAVTYGAAMTLGALPLSGGTMSGAIAMGSNKITGLANGSGAQDAAAFGQIPTSVSSIGGIPQSVSVQTLASAAASITFSSIPGTYNMLRLVVIGASAAAAQSDQWTVQLNGDTGNHYDLETFYAAGTGTGASDGSNAQAVWISAESDMPGANATAGIAGILDLTIPAYAGTTFQKVGIWRSGYYDAVTAITDGFVVVATESWRSMAAITSIVIATHSGSNLAAGTTAILYLS